MLRDGPGDSLIDENLRVCVCVLRTQSICVYVSKAPHLNYTQGLSGLSPLLIFRPVRQLDDTLFRCDFLFSSLFQRYFLKTFSPLSNQRYNFNIIGNRLWGSVLGMS